VAYALAGTMLRDLMTEPVGQGKDGKDVWLGDIWPSTDEIHKLMKHAMNPKGYRASYAKVKSDPGKLWERIEGVKGDTYDWPESTYIAEPPFFEGFGLDAPTSEAAAAADTAAPVSVREARIIALFGDSITTDHISPAGSIRELAGGPLAAGARRDQDRLQQLRLAPRHPRSHDARYLRQRAHPQPDAAGRAGRLARGGRPHDLP
jgi:aconitase A